MKCATSSASWCALASSIFTLSAVILATALTTSCGSGGSTSKTSPLSGNTQVAVVLTSAANDQLSELDLEFQGITLTSQSGKTVSLFSAQQPSEFIHLNGAIDPLITATIPQDVYAAASVNLNFGELVCIANGMSEGAGLVFAYYNSNLSASSVSVTLPSPTGAATRTGVSEHT